MNSNMKCLQKVSSGRSSDCKHTSAPIEGKFGQAKTAYGLNCIKARLQQTSESWIASIIMVLNLVKLAGQIPYYLLSEMIVEIIFY